MDFNISSNMDLCREIGFKLNQKKRKIFFIFINCFHLTLDFSGFKPEVHVILNTTQELQEMCGHMNLTFNSFKGFSIFFILKTN